MNSSMIKIGDRYNYLVCIEESKMVQRDTYKKPVRIAKFRCDCGVEKYIMVSSVRCNTTKSCGCYNRKAASERCKSGKKRFRDLNQSLYHIYKSIKDNCSWSGYDEFYDWAIRYWKPRSFIVRYNSLWYYCPENCALVLKKKKEKIKKVKLNFNKPVICTCDYCGDLVLKKYFRYKKSLEVVYKVSCSKIDCKKQKLVDVNLVKYGVEYTASLDSVRKKCKETLIEKYGVDNPNKSPEIRAKSKKTNIERYGVENPFQSEEIKKKIKEKNLEKYGYEYPGQIPEFKEKQKQTMLNRYGVEKALQKKEFLDKATNTMKDRYGVEHYALSPEFREKICKKYRLYNGKTLRELAKESGKAYTTFSQQRNQFGLEYAINSPSHLSSLEKKFSDILIELDISYKTQYTIDKYRCDFKIDNLLIEVDGLYWHSDECVEDNYHIKKKNYLNSKGYQVIFFRENEVLTAYENTTKSKEIG